MDCRGDAIIVSIEKCKGRLRPRAVDDRERMVKVFRMLKFRVVVLESKSAEGLKTELTTELRNIINNIGDRTSDCFVCSVSAYGFTERDHRQVILDQEGDKLYVVDNIIEPCMACEWLDKKPRVFFINLCNGNFDLHTSNSGARKLPPRSRNRRLKLLNDKKDLLAVFSTEEECQGGQDLRNGTRFLPLLLNSLDQNHNNKSVVQIINEANCCQTISVTNTLKNELFWRTRELEVLPGAQMP